MSARTVFAPALVLLLLAGPPALADSEASETAEGSDASSDSRPSGYTPEDQSVSPFRISGYVDVGFAKAQGRGSSFVPDDTRVPADYGVDAFAPAVNSRGEVASLDANGRFVNGFLPRTVDIGGHGSFLLNTASLDLFYEPSSAPVLVFARAQFLPRFEKGSGGTRLLLQQAFGRVTPFSGHEFMITVGRFDSVFGIEYLENESPLRTGITPSLMARYTTGHQLGVKALYRRQLPVVSSAVSLNVAVTNGSSRVDSLQTPDLSLTGLPFVSARLGYELQLLRLQVKLGVSGQTGARNDQDDSHVHQTQLGADARLTAGWFSLSGEYVRARDGAGTAPGKYTGLGDFFYASAFSMDGMYGTLALAVPVEAEALRTATVYGRYDRRAAEFHGFGGILTSRYTVGTRLDFWSVLALKAEYLFNRENAGAPRVENDVFAASAVYVF
jgi:hypothetical protein